MLNFIIRNNINKLLSGLDTRDPIVFNALGDPGRYKIFNIILRHDDLCVSEIAKAMRITPSAASQQLKILEMSGLLIRIRKGKMICYKVNIHNKLVSSLTKIIHKRND